MSQDLHGLGDTDSAPIEVAWTPPSKIPGLLPWVVLLALLAIRFNHSFDAWYALVPVLLMMGLQLSQGFLGSAMSSGDIEMFVEMIKIMAFGLAGSWLLFPWLKSDHRFVTLLKTVPVVWLVAGITVAAEQGAKEFLDGQTVALGFFTGILGVVLPAVLLLSALCCKRRYSPGRLLLWISVWSFGMAALAFTPIWVIALIASSSGPTIGEFFAVAGTCGGLIFVCLLPFVVLSLLNGFHRSRFKQWLGLEQPGVPPVASPAQAVVTG